MNETLEMVLTPEQVAEARHFFGISIQYGFHADDNGKNEGRGYVLAQVIDCADDMKLERTPSNLITLTAILMEILIPEHYAYTLDLPNGL